MEGYDKVVKEENGAKKYSLSILNALLGPNYYAFYSKHSEIVYEGDQLTVFGVFSYNLFTKQWELDKPIAFLKNKFDLINIYKWRIFGNYTGIVCLGILTGLCAVGIYYSVSRLARRYKDRVLRLIR